MSSLLANTSTMTFNAVPFLATSVVVEAGQPEVADMTTNATLLKKRNLVPTGDWITPTKINVDAIGRTDPVPLVGQIGPAVFTTASGVLASANCYCESASVEARVGDVFRCRFVFIETTAT
jgi:hypothetical protein